MQVDLQFNAKGKVLIYPKWIVKIKYTLKNIQLTHVLIYPKWIVKELAELNATKAIAF